MAIDDILTRRKVALSADTVGFGALEIDVIETFWLSPAAVVEMSLRRVRDLQGRRDVATIEPVIGMAPPQASSTVATVRTAMSTDPYYGLPPSGDKIALLDTGIRSSHEKLVDAPIRILGDCVDGGATCLGAGANHEDVCRRPGSGADQGHGTRSAALISGMVSGGTWHGLTKVPLDSYRVFTQDPTECAVVDPIAAARAFDVAVANGARVLVAEIQDTSSFYGAIARAADHANKHGGAVVVAAAGNTPGPGTVSAPASAMRVLGIGVHEGGVTDPLQSRGPTSDGRIKPDVQAPEDVVTASSYSNTATIAFDGTSCATALAGASAALLREWLMAGKTSIDPGQVYAQMILSGTRESPFTASAGAGPLRLPSGGRVWWGKASLSHEEEFEFEFPASEEWVERIDVAIWWPEDLELDANGLPVNERNDIDLFLYNPDGTERGRCETQGTVFERTSVFVPASKRGTWRLVVFAYDTHHREQTVYWTAVARPSAPGDDPPESTEVEQ